LILPHGGVGANCDVVSGALAAAMECLYLGSWTGPEVDLTSRAVSLEVENRCAAAVSLTPSFLGDAGAGPQVTLAPGAQAKITATLTTTPSKTIALVLRDSAAKARLGAFVLPFQ
jgi:hypothetical protein